MRNYIWKVRGHGFSPTVWSGPNSDTLCPKWPLRPTTFLLVKVEASNISKKHPSNMKHPFDPWRPQKVTVGSPHDLGHAGYHRIMRLRWVRVPSLTCDCDDSHSHITSTVCITSTAKQSLKNRHFCWQYQLWWSPDAMPYRSPQKSETLYMHYTRHYLSSDTFGTGLELVTKGH